MNYSIFDFSLEINKTTVHQICIQDLSNIERRVLKDSFVTYIYFNLLKGNVYIGETKDFCTRHDQHMRENHFLDGMFDRCLVIYNATKFTESHVKDLEFMLINHMFAEIDETNFKLFNRNNGQVQPIYNGHNEMVQIFVKLWEKDLFEKDLVFTRKLSKIRNKILFKYSPFKQLSQQQLECEEEIIKSIHNKHIVIGGAGTGKTILLMSLMYKLINNNSNLRIGIVTTGNLTDKFNRVLKQLNLAGKLKFERAGQLIKRAKQEKIVFDIILVDESHRLQRYYPKGHPATKKHFNKNEPSINELHLLEEVSKGIVLFYDQFQSIRPQDILRKDFKKQTVSYNEYNLNQQFRIKSNIINNEEFDGASFVKGILYALNITNERDFDPSVFKYKNKDSYFQIVNSISELFKFTNEMEKLHANTTNRVIAGYTKEWKSNPRSRQNKRIERSQLPFDWIEGSTGWHWNSQHEKWVELESSKKEIGSIHAIQGADIDYAGVIIGNDITINNKGRIVGVKENYKDTGGTPLIEGFNEEEFTDYILNIYYILLTRGIEGCKVYFEDPKVRKHFVKKISEGKSTSKISSYR
ncbi:DNA/RNA helicase domain-containing protein [Niallia circulans]|uniref:DNA/RNA helicase domain-containing protein n=1 Tax=Niallia circulans TaxID=1397 RepID=UPI0015C6D54E|nr:DNA/RNA helicase domain-containing protein [Niallia circulans]